MFKQFLLISGPAGGSSLSVCILNSPPKLQILRDQGRPMPATPVAQTVLSACEADVRLADWQSAGGYGGGDFRDAHEAMILTPPLLTIAPSPAILDHVTPPAAPPNPASASATAAAMIRRRARRCRVAAVIIFLLGAIGAGAVYWLGSRQPDYSN